MFEGNTSTRPGRRASSSSANLDYAAGRLLDDFDSSPSLLPFIDIVMAVQWLVYIPQPRPDDVILLRRQQTSTTPGVVFVDDLDITASFHRHEQFVMAVQRLVYIPSLDLINRRCSTSTVSLGPILMRHHSSTGLKQK